MSDAIHVDRQAMRDFVKLMHRTAQEMSEIRNEATPLYVGEDAASAPTPTVWRDGVKLTLGSSNVDTPSRHAGEVMASRIRETLDFVIGMEKHSRSLANAAEAILHSLDEQDDISSAQLNHIVDNADTPASPLSPPVGNAGPRETHQGGDTFYA